MDFGREVQDSDKYVEFGNETSDRIAIEPAKIYIERTVRHRFVLKSHLQIKNPEKQSFILPKLPESVIPKGMASESLLADILINKFIYHLPFYRQIQKYKEQGVTIPDSTIGDWFVAVCTRLYPLYELIKKRVLLEDYIQVDESTLPVIDNEKHRAVKGYVWAVRSPQTKEAFFYYDKGSRSEATAINLLGSYHGAIQSDGYQIYDTFEKAYAKITILCCWAHVRRKFHESQDENKTLALEALSYIWRLYELERTMTESNLTYDQIKELRQEKAYDIIRQFEKWMEDTSQKVTQKSKIGNAILYTYARLPRLSRYVLDGRYNIDNNGVENIIRPLALGRKNYLFCGNHDAAIRAAMFYTFFACCKACDIDIGAWLIDTLKRIPIESNLEQLIPVNWSQRK